MNLRLIFVILIAALAEAQSICPPFTFQNPRTINLNPTNTSHLTLIRQDDGSYTAIESENSPHNTVLGTIPHFERQFSNCLTRPASQASRKAAASSGNPANTVSQPAAFAVLGSGNYLFVTVSAASSLDVALFDQNLQNISEQQTAVLPDGNPPPEGTGRYLSLSLVDVNGDGKLDLVAQYEFIMQGEAFGGGGVIVLLGDDQGGFRGAGGFPLSGIVNGSMAVGDLNGDGKPDIVVGAPGPVYPEAAGNIVVALGNGDGTFSPTLLPIPGLIGPAEIAIADLNKDGKNDLVFLTAPLSDHSPFFTNEAAVMIGNGNGTFSSAAVFPVQVTSADSAVDEFDLATGALAVGDVNGDGAPDIVTNGITILFGDGKGGFPNRKDFLNTSRESVVLTDFDGDGNMDIAIGSGNPLLFSPASSLQDTLTVFFGDGTGDFAAPPVAPLPIETLPVITSPDGPQILMTSADFNHDGIPDLAVIGALHLSVLLGRAGGTPSAVFNFDPLSTDSSPTSIIAGDFNQDGIPDLAVSFVSTSSQGSIKVLLGVGDGTFLAPVISNSAAPLQSLVAADFNKDGRLDLAAIAIGSDTYHVLVFPGQGDGTFGAPQSYPAGMLAFSLELGDFNQDGSVDIAIGNYNGVQLLLGKADGTFSPGINVSLESVFPLRPMAAADLNGDGRLDLVAGATILLGRGDGTFAPPVSYPTGLAEDQSVGSVAVGDMNGDGIPDVVLGTGGILVGNGDGTFLLQVSGLPGIGSVIAADFNGDGTLDIAGGFSMNGIGLITNGVPYRIGAAIVFNFSHPTPILDVVSAADFSHGPMSPHSIASAFGKHLALSVASAGPMTLPTTLGGSSVSVQDQSGKVSQAEIYYASPGQVNFIVPAGMEAGSAIVTITTTDGKSASTEIQMAPIAPKLFIVDPSGIPAGYVVRVGPKDVQTIEPIFTAQGGNIQAVPIVVSKDDVYLVLFGTGFDIPPDAEVELNSTYTTVNYAGPQGQFPGLDQVNILLPKSLAGLGSTRVGLFQRYSANGVFITIK